MSISITQVETSSAAKFGMRPWSVIAGSAAKATLRPVDEFAALSEIGVRLSFGRNETIFEEGDIVKYCYRLISGSVRLCKLLADGRRQIADFFLPGDFFGFVDIDTYAFSAETIGDVVVMRYARSRVEMLSDGDIHLRRKLNRLLHERLSATQTHLVMLGRHTVKERVASFLIQMTDRLGQNDTKSGEIDLPMGRLDIADYLGLTIETVCRAISELKRAGIIAVPNTHCIALRDIEALRDLAEGERLLSA
jgi:CRP-like cAMP-binding protein